MFTRYTTEITTGDDGKELRVRTSVHGFAVYGIVEPFVTDEGETLGNVFNAYLDDHVIGKKTELARVVAFETAMKKVHEGMLSFIATTGGAPEAAGALEKALF